MTDPTALVEPTSDVWALTVIDDQIDVHRVLRWSVPHGEHPDALLDTVPPRWASELTFDGAPTVYADGVPDIPRAAIVLLRREVALLTRRALEAGATYSTGPPGESNKFTATLRRRQEGRGRWFAVDKRCESLASDAESAILRLCVAEAGDVPLTMESCDRLDRFARSVTAEGAGQRHAG